MTGVALLAGMQITGDGVDIFGLYGLAALLVLVGFGWASRGGVPLPHDPGRPADADPGLPDPVPRAGLRAAALLRGWIHAVASVNPATAFLDAGAG